jgi:microsomal dipeptidase-like Zn-dependent dipeptidase
MPLLVEGGHAESGFPKFEHWPAASTVIHQQMYWEWIQRAHASGLRLLCALAVNNEYLPHLFHGGFHAKNSDNAAIGAQLAGMDRMVAEHQGFMEIARSPADARRIITAGKLAIVLGIEVDTLGAARRPEDTTDQAVTRLIDTLWAKGVRMITPIHLANNAFGGCACGRDAFNILNHWLHRKLNPASRRWWEIDTQVTGKELRGVELLLGRDAEDRPLRNAYAHKYSKYDQRKDGHINRLGLSPIGRTLVRRMMKRGMLIDIDHMSMHARDRVLGMAEDIEYPVVSSHSGFRELGRARPAGTGASYRGVRSEGMLERRAVSRIRALGGIVAPISRVGPIGNYAHPEHPDFPAVSAQDTSHSWAHAYLYALEVMGDQGGVAIGTDFNGLAQQPRGRFAGTPIGTPRRVQYGRDSMLQTTTLLTRSDRPGKKSFDVNTDGLAHYGLLPDFLRDVANQFGSDEPLVPFFRSAQRFIETWERCERASAHV